MTLVISRETWGNDVRSLHLIMNTTNSTFASAALPGLAARRNARRPVRGMLPGDTATAAQAARLTQALGRWVPANQWRKAARSYVTG
ncbi:hypothetical protein OpiT1DRAFT_02760 [Opitutaceae bacterium TAV1]|nr:hypothetical protein OPIT5_12470 [Opitutaceae bacterium TAV5]EIP98305.1 hypothetical protein OpiT1DRAFT_02760 [Opitutaceae bacterium TAV1]